MAFRRFQLVRCLKEDGHPHPSAWRGKVRVGDLLWVTMPLKMSEFFWATSFCWLGKPRLYRNENFVACSLTTPLYVGTLGGGIVLGVALSRTHRVLDILLTSAILAGIALLDGLCAYVAWHTCVLPEPKSSREILHQNLGMFSVVSVVGFVTIEAAGFLISLWGGTP